MVMCVSLATGWLWLQPGIMHDTVHSTGNDFLRCGGVVVATTAQLSFN